MKQTKYVLLSYAIEENTPLYGNTPVPTIRSFSCISDGANSNSSIINVHNHTGTHVDAPAHFIDGAKKISEYSFDELILNNILLLECHTEVDDFVPLKKILSSMKISEHIDCLLLKTGFGIYRQEKLYRTNNPGILSDDIIWLRKNFPLIKCIGIDSISISAFQHKDEGRKAHIAAFSSRPDLGKPLLLIEDMNLTYLASTEYIKELFIIGWQINGIDSAPCTVIAKLSTQR